MSTGVVDKIGTAYEDDILATGFGGYIALPLMREKYRPDMEEGEARALLEDCLRILFYRDCRALNRVQIAKVTEDGVLVSDPYELDTYWDFKGYQSNKGEMGTGKSMCEHCSSPFSSPKTLDSIAFPKMVDGRITNIKLHTEIEICILYSQSSFPYHC